MEPDLTRWNQRLAHALVEVSPDAFVAIAEDTRVLFWNQGAHGLFGYTSEEATGRPLLDLIVPPDRREEALGLLAKAIETGSSSGDSIRRLKDGASFTSILRRRSSATRPAASSTSSSATRT
jgi:PAS domain S-box-containing protein